MAFGISASALFMGGTSLLGSLIGSDSASSAQASQEAGAARSDATQRYMYDQTRADQAPFRETGVAANTRLAQLMGLGPSDAGGGARGLSREQLRNELVGQFTAGNTGGSMYYGPTGDYNESAYGPFTPYLTGGTPSINEAGLNAAIEARMSAQPRGDPNDPATGSLMRNFTMADRDADPVYQSGLQFGLDEGTKGIERQQQAKGSMLSGATLKALARFGSDYGSTKAQGAFERFGSQQDRTYNKLAGLSGTGQVATGAMGQAGQNYATNVSNTAQALGTARGASAIAQGNAWTGGIQNAIGGYQQNEFLKMLQANRGSGYSGSTGYTDSRDPLGDFISQNRW